MKSERNLFDQVDPEAEERADERAEADAAEGRTISHEAVTHWLRSWGTDAPLPRPNIGD